MEDGGINLRELLYSAERLKNDNSDYVMFMLHSSEMMPGGSPTFKTNEDIEHLYKDLRSLFDYISTFCEGRTLKEYAALRNKDEIVYKLLF